MAAKPLTIVRGKRIRVTRVGPCGEPPEPGEGCATVVSRGFVTVSLSPQIEEGEEFVERNADGSLAVNQQGEHNFKRWNIGLSLINVDPELVSLLTTVNLEVDEGGDTVGFRSVESRIDERFAFELWTGVSDEACIDGESYGYLLFPFVAGGTIGDLEIENGVSTFSIDNAFTRKGSLWGVGPYDVVPDEMGDPAPLGVPVGELEHHVQRYTTVAPPEPTEGCVDAPDEPE